jgi:hypothetical protein
MEVSMFDIRRSVMIVAFSLFCLGPALGYGDLVTGKVDLVSECSEFKIFKGKAEIQEVKTDNQGNYRVYLEPGQYTAKCGKRSVPIRGSNKSHFVQNIKFNK